MSLQITKYVEREIMNHRSLMHPHIVQFKEVSPFASDSSQAFSLSLCPSTCCAGELLTNTGKLQVFVTSQYLAIAMEYAAGGDMFEHVVRKGGLKESEARWFFQQLLVGVDYVHRMVSASPQVDPS